MSVLVAETYRISDAQFRWFEADAIKRMRNLCPVSMKLLFINKCVDCR